MTDLRPFLIALQQSQPIRHMSQFGQALIDHGAVTSRAHGRQTQQGLALLGGLWIARLSRAGLTETRTENGRSVYFARDQRQGANP